MTPKRWAGRVALLLIAAGLGISLYLFSRGNTLKAGGAGEDVCSAVFDVSCDATLTSEYASVLGFPVAGWGAVYFAALGALALGGIALGSLFQRPALSAALLANFVGLGVSGYLGWLFVSGSVPLCPLCAVTHVLNFLLFGALLLYRGGSPVAFLKDVSAGIGYVMSPGLPSTTENTARTVAFVAVALFAAVVYLALALRTGPAASPLVAAATPGAVSATDQVVRNILQAYADQPPVDVPVSPNDPRLGPADAPAQLVVFSDFECSSCKANSVALERLAKKYEGRISIVAKNYPLSSACNRAINTNPHQFACGAAYAAVAAHMQGKFWPFHDLVFRLKGEPTPEALVECARLVGLDVSRFQSDMASEGAKAKVAEDTELGIKLKVIQTPTMFLNNRLLTSSIAPHVELILQTILTESAGAGD